MTILCRSPLILLGKLSTDNFQLLNTPEEMRFEAIFNDHQPLIFKVKDDGMMNEGIFVGDLLICHEPSTITEGATILAVIDGEQATIKRLSYNNQPLLTLISLNENASEQTFEASRIEIKGNYIGMIRRDQKKKGK